ncbi:hypothetical protein CHI04_05615 [Bacillus safensis]|nr:hypothetical protein CHI04_05615 [Bacillus safensis]
MFFDVNSTSSERNRDPLLFFVYAYIFLGKKRVLKKIYYNINKERKEVVEFAFVCKGETSFIKALTRFL